MMRFWLTVAFLIGVSGACSAQSDTPSLGEVARQNKSEKKAKIVLTEDDIPNSPATHSATPAPPAISQSAELTKSQEKAASSDSAKGSNNSKPSAQDSSPAAQMKQKLASLKEQQESYKRSAKRYQDLLATEPSDFRRQMYQDALDNDQKNVSLFQKNIDELEAQIAKQH